MKIIKQLFALVLVAALLYGAWVLLAWSIDVLSGFSKEVATAIITATAGLLGLLYVQWYSKSKEISDSHRPQKIEAYNNFFDIVERFTQAQRAGEEVDVEDGNIPPELMEQFARLSRGMITWASPPVIRAWLKFRMGAGENASTLETLFLVDDVLQAIRKDLGNSNFGLSRGDVIKIYLSDPGELDG